MITSDDITAAAARIAPYIRRTPVLTVEAGALADVAVTLKLEQTQVTGSFKVRGAFNNLLTRDVPTAGVVAASGGNHGAAVAYAATKLGVPSTIFLPEVLATEVKRRRMEGFGAEVIVAPGTVGDAMKAYAAHGRETGKIALHPYDTAPTLTGQGTLGLEIEAQAPDLDTLLVSVGGGGLIGGIAAWYAGRIKVIAVETEGTATLDHALKHGPGGDLAVSGIARSGLGAPDIGVLPLEIAKAHVARNIVVSDAEVFAAQARLWETTRLVGEPGATVALAALTSGAYRPQAEERVGVLVCGGNADPHWFLD